MKRIILFTFFAIMIYAGGLMLYYGVSDALAYDKYPRNLEAAASDSFKDGQAVMVDIYQTVAEIGSLANTVQPDVFGIPIGEQIHHTYFLIPLGYEEDIYHQKYMLLSVSDEEDAEALRAIMRKSPGKRRPEDQTVAFKGVLRANDRYVMQVVANRLKDDYKFLLGVDYVYTAGDAMFYNRVIPYTIYKEYRDGVDYTPIILGGALVLVGGGLAVLLIIRIKREKDGY